MLLQEALDCIYAVFAGTASDPTQATRDLSSSNRGRLLNQVCSSFEESKLFEG